MKIFNKVAICLGVGILLSACSRTYDRLPEKELKRETGILSVDLKDVNDVSVLESADIDSETGTVTLIPKVLCRLARGRPFSACQRQHYGLLQTCPVYCHFGKPWHDACLDNKGLDQE